jgi:hypothetical protein
MKFTVEVSEFYLGEDGEIETQLREYVIRDVISQINKSIESKVEEHITRRVKDEVEKNLIYMMNKKIADCIATEQITVSGKKVSIESHIRGIFETNHGWNNPNDAMKKLADTFAKELKARYDIGFASHIVAKLHENGLLKEEAAKILLSPSKQSGAKSVVITED